MSKEKAVVQEKDKAAVKNERAKDPVSESVADPAQAAFNEALAKAESEFQAASATGDRKLISNAAQKVADIKEQEQVRLSNLEGFSERLVDTNPQAD